MAQVNFIGKDQNWLEARLNQLYEYKAAGQRFMRIESAGNLGIKEKVLSITACEEMLLWDLHLVDPITYPTATVQRVSRTKMTAYNPPRFYF